MMLDAFARHPLTFGPSPVHRLERLTARGPSVNRSPRLAGRPALSADAGVET